MNATVLGPLEIGVTRGGRSRIREADWSEVWFRKNIVTLCEFRTIRSSRLTGIQKPGTGYQR